MSWNTRAQTLNIFLYLSKCSYRHSIEWNSLQSVQYHGNSVQKQWVSQVKKRQWKKYVFSYKFSQFPPSLYEVTTISEITMKGKKRGPNYAFKYFLHIHLFFTSLFDQVLKFLTVFENLCTWDNFYSVSLQLWCLFSSESSRSEHGNRRKTLMWLLSILLSTAFLKYFTS